MFEHEDVLAFSEVCSILVTSVYSAVAVWNAIPDLSIIQSVVIKIDQCKTISEYESIKSPPEPHIDELANSPSLSKMTLKYPFVMDVGQDANSIKDWGWVILRGADLDADADVVQVIGVAHVVVSLWITYPY